MRKRSLAEAGRPTDAELDILNVLWRLGPVTVRQAHDELSQTKPWEYSTTLKMMQIMATKGLLERDETERSHVYRPVIQREATQQQLVERLIDRAFGGSVRNLLLGAMEAKRTSKAELEELRQLIEERSKGSKGSKGKKR